MAQTAIQWLKEQYINRGETLPSGVFQEALEMEKEQIKSGFEDGIAEAANEQHGRLDYNMDAEQYYNTEYKSK